MSPVFSHKKKGAAIPVNSCQKGSDNSIIRDEIKTAIILIIKDSIKNCRIKDQGPAPTTLRSPTSFALSIERAVERLM